MNELQEATGSEFFRERLSKEDATRVRAHAEPQQSNMQKQRAGGAD